MGDFGLSDWDDIADQERWDTLLIGNGASRAVSADFSYASLFDEAPLTEDDDDLFQALNTSNFEEVLYHLRTAKLVCEQLGHDHEAVQERYESIRLALIDSVHTHHVSWADVTIQGSLDPIRTAMREFTQVFTTNYDLITYWAMLSDPNLPGDGFGDMFWNHAHVFDPMDVDPHPNITMLYWLHGALHLNRTADGGTRKRVANGANLLQSFAVKTRIPLFVSEGAWQQKLRAIRRSDYLDHVYEKLFTTEGPMVVFGQALGHQDEHIVRAITHLAHREIAYGVFASNALDANDQRARIEARLNSSNVTFFDSRTHPLGDPALMVA